MVDREKVVVVLRRRFPGATMDQIAAATNAIIGLDDEWVELSLSFEDWNAAPGGPCRASCYLSRLAQAGGQFRVFTRTENGRS
jgi:hypothetical protein